MAQAQLVPISKRAPPSAAQRRTDERIQDGQRIPQAITGHFNPTAQQYHALLKQSRRRPIIAHDALWSLMQQQPPPFSTAPIPADPMMDQGVSTQYALQLARLRKRELKQRDKSMETESAGYALSAVQSTVVPFDPSDRFLTTAKASQSRVITAAAALREAGEARVPQRRLMPERSCSQIEFSNTKLELDFIAMQEAAIALKTTQQQPTNDSINRSTMTGTPVASAGTHSRRSAEVGQLKYAFRAATALGCGMVPGPSPLPQTTAIDKPKHFHLQRSLWDQEGAVHRREREVEFAAIKRLPRPSNMLKEAQAVFSLQ